MSEQSIILVTGATGKVGRAFIHRLLADSKFESFHVRALCHNRQLDSHPRIQNIHGSIEHRKVVDEALLGIGAEVAFEERRHLLDELLAVEIVHGVASWV